MASSPPPAGRLFMRLGGVLGGGGCLGARQVKPERRAKAPLAVDVDVAAGLLDEAEHHREAEPAALADRLGGEERLENPAENVHRDSGPCIADLDQHINRK